MICSSQIFNLLELLSSVMLNYNFRSSPRLNQYIFKLWVSVSANILKEWHKASDANPLCLCCPGLCLPLSAVLGSAELLSAAQHQDEGQLSPHETTKTDGLKILSFEVIIFDSVCTTSSVSGIHQLLLFSLLENQDKMFVSASARLSFYFVMCNWLKSIYN